MFTRTITLFRLFGIAVKVDASWLILGALVTWSLAVGLFPQFYEGLPPATYWLMGLAGAIGLLVSIVLHELSHAYIARRRGIPIQDITLFIFGGVASMGEEPQDPKTEVLMAAAGPIMSFVLAALCFVAYVVLRPVLGTPPALGVMLYLAWLNLVLGAFNLVPAFPLDGGRVLRAGLWGWRGDLRWATRVASTIGTGFGWALIALGVLSFFTGNIVGGIWWFLIGMFVRAASQQSYKQLLIRRALEGEPVQRFMRTDPVTVPSNISLRDLVDDYIYRWHYKMYPVTENGQLVGCISTRDIAQVPREDWERRHVGDVIHECSLDNTVRPNEDAMDALARMSKTGNSRLLVIDNGRLAGVVSLKDLMRFLAVKMDLEVGAQP